jgi:hypothetical protein
MKPSIGRIVHYVGWGEKDLHCAAIITDVHLDQHPDLELVGVHIFAPPRITRLPAMLHGADDIDNVCHDEETKKPGTWHWPEQQPELRS